MDIIRPNDPSSSQGDIYILCISDQNTRKPEAIPMPLSAGAA